LETKQEHRGCLKTTTREGSQWLRILKKAYQFQNVRFVANSTVNGRVGAVYDPAYPVHFANPSVSPANSATAYLPTCVTEAKYVINIAPLSGHNMFGFTASGKNWFGSICWRNGGWTPSPLHNFGLRNNPMGSCNHSFAKIPSVKKNGLYGHEIRSL
jgi:hypothetical protein